MQPGYWPFEQASYSGLTASYAEECVREMTAKGISPGRKASFVALVEIVRSGFDAGEGKRTDAFGFDRGHFVQIL